jgi:hypothetical protein
MPQFQTDVKLAVTGIYLTAKNAENAERKTSFNHGWHGWPWMGDGNSKHLHFHLPLSSSVV